MARYIICATQSGKSRPPAAFIAASGYEYVERRGRSLARLQQECAADGVIVWQEGGPVLHREGYEFYFHPSMAKNRLAAWRKQGIKDAMAAVAGLSPEDRWLDCTAGLGSDAIVAAYFTASPVLALESEPVIALIVKWGMRCYQTRMTWLKEAIDRVEIINAEHQEFLQQQPDDSFDTVFFDPMFEQPLLKSNSIAPLRGLANHTALRRESVAEACRVARRNVMMKGNADGGAMRQLGFEEIIVSSNRRIAYGIIRKRKRGR